MWKAEMIADGEVVCCGIEDTPEGACFDLIRTIMNDWKAGIHDVCGDYVKEIGEAIIEIEGLPVDEGWGRDWHSQCGDFVGPWTLRVFKSEELGDGDAPPVIVNEETTAYAPVQLTPKSGDPALAKEVYEGIYSASDSLHDFGGNVAYLVGGILTGSGLAFHGTLDEGEAEFLEFLRDVFEEEHPVWKHVDLSEVDETEQE